VHEKLCQELVRVGEVSGLSVVSNGMYFFPVVAVAVKKERKKETPYKEGM
jgi:hypothetical protein